MQISFLSKKWICLNKTCDKCIFSIHILIQLASIPPTVFKITHVLYLMRWLLKSHLIISWFFVIRTLDKIFGSKMMQKRKLQIVFLFVWSQRHNQLQTIRLWIIEAIKIKDHILRSPIKKRLKTNNSFVFLKMVLSIIRVDTTLAWHI